MLSGDWHSIHADAHCAASSALGQRVFQGGYRMLMGPGDRHQWNAQPLYDQVKITQKNERNRNNLIGCAGDNLKP